MERIASLLPSTTEIVCALGLESALVGRSHECDFPVSVASLPVLTEPVLDPSAGSAEIDHSVKRLIRDGLSVYRVDVERLRELAPTVILTQDQCKACAVSLADVENALGEWIGERSRVISLQPATLGDVWGDVRRVADALDRGEKGREVVKALAERVADVAERTLRIRDQPTVACIEWIDPLMAAGNWMPDLVALAGGHNLFGESGTHSPWLEWNDLRKTDPEVLVVLPCGFDLQRTRAEIGPLQEQDGFNELRAVRRERIYLTDGHHYFNRPGPRLVESLEILAEILHPDQFSARFQNHAWQHL